MIKLQKIHYAWPDEAPLLQDVTFSVSPGEKIVLLGANGCGKSTLLKLMNGLLQPAQGKIFWQGEVLDHVFWRDAPKSSAFRRSCVLLFQHPEAMLFNPTVRDELAYSPQKLRLNDIDARVMHWARQLRIETLLDKAPFQLSGGQKQKVALASLLTLDPDCLLLDEPSANLDPVTIGWLIDFFAYSSRTLVVATHNLLLAAELSNRCLLMSPEGCLIYDGSLENVLTDTSLLDQAGLLHHHMHKHEHENISHTHVHSHNGK